jgi:uncharacterized Fe-S cluster protein YjdI
VVLAQSEIGAVRRVVQQLPVEVLQQCSSASSCMQMHIIIERLNTVCQHSMDFVLNGPTQLFSVSQYKLWLSSEVADFFDTGIQKLIL